MTRRMIHLALHPTRWLLGYRGIPWMSRPTYRYDFLSGILISLGAGVLIPTLLQLFALNTLGAKEWIVPVLGAGIAAGNLLGAFTSQIIQRNRRIPYMVAGRLALAGGCLAIAALPAQASSIIPFTVLSLLIFVVMSISLNVLTAVWQSNYPDKVRGRIVSRIFLTRLLVTAGAARLAAVALDELPWGHHLVYSLSAVFVVLSAIVFAKIRVRGERAIIRRHRKTPLRWFSGFDILKHDRAYRWYMIYQFIGGCGNLMLCTGVLLLAVRNIFQIDFRQGASSFVLIPAILTLISLPLGGHLFDHMRITRLRAMGMGLFGVCRSVQLAGLLMQSWELLLAGFALEGITQGMTRLLWSMAHTRYASPADGPKYQGVHMTLTGIRGLTIPFLGTWLYVSSGLGLYMFLIAIALIAIAGVGMLWAPEPDVPLRNRVQSRSDDL